MTPEMQLQIFGDPEYLQKNQMQFYDGSTVPMAAPFSDSIVEEESTGIRSIPFAFEDQFKSFRAPEPYLPPTYKIKQGETDMGREPAPEPSDDLNLMLQNLEAGRPNENAPMFTTGDVVPDTVDSLFFKRGENTGGGFKGIVPGLINSILPFDNRVRPMQGFYGKKFGLDNIGRIASGPLKGYNPVSGGLLYGLSGGRLGQSTNVGLQRALEKKIATRKSDKTLARLRKNKSDIDAFNQKTKVLEDLLKDERQFRIDSAPRDVRQQIAENRKIDSDTKYGLL
jgi:hypothetical protein